MKNMKNMEWGRMTKKERRSAKKQLGAIPMAHLYQFTKIGDQWAMSKKK